MANIPTFVPSTTFLGTTTPSRRSSISPARPARAARPMRPMVAVLDTPASNTYLQRNAEVILRDFLTRRAVHTVMYYMAEMRDGPTKNWLANFEGFSERVKQDNFHDGDGFLDRMLRSRKEKGTFKISHPRGYFSRTYSFTIDPHHVAKRIIDSRVQLASEWANDLRCIEAENLEIQRMGFEKMLCNDEKVLMSKQNLIFDSDPLASDQTPLRYRNYMALKVLITQQAIVRLLPFLRDRGSNHEYMYLLRFVNSHGPLEKGDKFIRTLMECPIETRTNPTHTIQPKAIATQIMELRRVIAQEWITVMECLPEEQLLRAREMLETSMDMSTQLGEDIRRPKQTPASEKAPEAETDDVDTVA